MFLPTKELYMKLFLLTLLALPIVAFGKCEKFDGAYLEEWTTVGGGSRMFDYYVFNHIDSDYMRLGWIGSVSVGFKMIGGYHMRMDGNFSNTIAVGGNEKENLSFTCVNDEKLEVRRKGVDKAGKETTTVVETYTLLKNGNVERLWVDHTGLNAPRTTEMKRIGGKP